MEVLHVGCTELRRRRGTKRNVLLLQQKRKMVKQQDAAAPSAASNSITNIKKPRQRNKGSHRRKIKNDDDNDADFDVPSSSPAVNNSIKSMSNKKLSHSLSWALRHAAINIGLNIKEDGYVPVQEIIDSKHPKLRGATLENIQNVVNTSDKQRFKLEERPACLYYPMKANNNDEKKKANNGNANEKMTEEHKILCIRANQGHSITIIDPEQLLSKLSPDKLRALSCIVHGTYVDAWNLIQKQGGLKKMNRTHIHFASGLPTDDNDVISGMRKTCTVYIYVNASKCADTDGRIEFYTSDNGVILTDGIDNSGLLPIKYFSHVTDKLGNILFENRE